MNPKEVMFAWKHTPRKHQTKQEKFKLLLDGLRN